MQIPELPTLEVVSFVTSEENQSQDETTVVMTFCPTNWLDCDSEFDCTETACSSSDDNGGNSCTDQCVPPSAAGC